MFDGNPLLRSAEEAVSYTKEMQEEYLRCMNDIIYFAEKYCYIITLDEGKVLIKLWDFQKKVLKAMVDPPEFYNEEEDIYEKKQHVIILASRQISKTTLSSIFILHYAIFNQDKTIAVLANKEKTALEIIQKIKMIYENLPFWLQPGLKSAGWSKSRIEFGNGSRIIGASTASTGIRGFSINCLFLDEYSFVPASISDEFMASVYPTISSGKSSKIIMVSTPNGLNHFYNIWSDAIKGKNQYYPIKINWYDRPDRDETFKQKVIRDIGITRWLAEYQCCKGNSKIVVRNKETNEIKKVSLEDLYTFGNSIFDK